MLYFFLGLVVGMMVAAVLLRHKSSPVNRLNESRHLKKETRKNQILKLFGTKSQITNNDVETQLEVSDRTASRYLGELESEGKIVQHGKTKTVYYTKR